MTVEEMSALMLSMEERRRLAMLHADLSTLRDLLDESLVYIHSTGGRDNRTSYLEKLDQGLVLYDKLEFLITGVQSSECFALVSGRMVARIQLPDRVLNVQSCYEAVWMQRMDGWVLIVLKSYPDDQKPQRP